MNTRDTQTVEQLMALTEDERREMLMMKEEGRLPTVINRSLDVYFRFLLAYPARIELLKDLVNSIFVALGRPPIKALELRNSEQAPLSHGNKHTRLDISATDRKGRILDIELQRENHSGFIARTLMYLDKLFVSQLRSGKDYVSLKSTIVINLLAFDMFDTERALWNFLFMNPPTGKILTDMQEIFYLEMLKVHRRLAAVREKVKANPNYTLTDEERLWVWGGYMTNDESGVAVVQTTADAVFQQVNDAEKEYWSSWAVQYRQFQEEMAEMDQRAFLSDAINKGLAQGLQEGRAEGEAKGRAEGLTIAASRMRAAGMSEEDIRRFTSLE